MAFDKTKAIIYTRSLAICLPWHCIAAWRLQPKGFALVSMPNVMEQGFGLHIKYTICGKSIYPLYLVWARVGCYVWNLLIHEDFLFMVYLGNSFEKSSFFANFFFCLHISHLNSHPSNSVKFYGFSDTKTSKKVASERKIIRMG